MAAAAAATASSPPPPTSVNKRRAANLLRDYYGLGSSSDTATAVPPDPTCPDNPAFDKTACLSFLLASNNLSQLLSKESQLLTEIRELDGERQSLVYNHHHELVAASDTIRNMKLKSESLHPSLESLRSSFSTMYQLSTELEVLRPPATAESDGGAAATKQIDPLKDLEPIVTLPTTLKDLIEQQESRQGLAQAERLWGQMQAVLTAWSDARVVGVKEIMSECRAVLKDGRKAAGTAALS